MKIALVYDAVYPWIKGGGEKTLYELACELRDRGHEIHFFGMHCWPGPRDIQHEGMHYHAIAPGGNLYRAKGRRPWWQPLKFAWGVLTRLPRYRLHEFDLVDLQAFPFASGPAFWLARRWCAPQLPWLMTWLEVWGRDYWRRTWGRLALVGAPLERWCARHAPAHLCISPTTGRRLREFFQVPASRVHVIPRGFVPPTMALPPRIARRVVIAGRMMPYKRFDLAVAAWPRVLAQLPDARLVVVGDGPERARCQALASQLGVAEQVEFLGQLPERVAVLSEIARASLLLQPSTREGQSTVVLEALALATPVLAADGPETAVADFLGRQPPVDCCLLPLDAPPELWAQRVVSLLTDEARWAELSRHGLGQVAELDWTRHIAPRVEALYRHVIDAAGMPPLARGS